MLAWIPAAIITYLIAKKLHKWWAGVLISPLIAITVAFVSVTIWAILWSGPGTKVVYDVVITGMFASVDHMPLFDLNGFNLDLFTLMVLMHASYGLIASIFAIGLYIARSGKKAGPSKQ